jgi:hypothetical protein
VAVLLDALQPLAQLAFSQCKRLARQRAGRRARTAIRLEWWYAHW